MKKIIGVAMSVALVLSLMPMMTFAGTKDIGYFDESKIFYECHKISKDKIIDEDYNEEEDGKFDYAYSCNVVYGDASEPVDGVSVSAVRVSNKADISKIEKNKLFKKSKRWGYKLNESYLSKIKDAEDFNWSPYDMREQYSLWKYLPYQDVTDMSFTSLAEDDYLYIAVTGENGVTCSFDGYPEDEWPEEGYPGTPHWGKNAIAQFQIQPKESQEVYDAMHNQSVGTVKISSAKVSKNKKNTNRKVTVSHAKNSKATKYQVYVKNNKTKKVISKTTTGKSVKLTKGFKKGQKVTVKIRPIKTKGHIIGRGKWKTKTVKLK